MVATITKQPLHRSLLPEMQQSMTRQCGDLEWGLLLGRHVAMMATVWINIVRRIWAGDSQNRLNSVLNYYVMGSFYYHPLMAKNPN